MWKLVNDDNWIIINAHFNSVQNWLSSIRASNPPVQIYRLVVLLWSIWKTRNNKVFHDEIFNPLTISIIAKKASIESHYV